MEIPKTPSSEPKPVDTTSCLSETQLAEIPWIRKAKETMKTLGFSETEIERRSRLLLEELKGVMCSSTDTHVEGVVDLWLARQVPDAPLQEPYKPT